MNCIIWGGTGQAKVARPILEAAGHYVMGVFDNNLTLSAPFADRPLFGGLQAFEVFRARLEGPCGFVVAIGGAGGMVRCSIGGELSQAGLQPLHVIHGRAFVAESCHLGVGCQVMAMAAVSEETAISDYCIVNTSASVDHECRIGRGVHIMPGATLAGDVEVGDYATIGSNATVLPHVRIGEGAFVGAGAVVIRDVAARSTVTGVPARERRSHS